MNGGVCGSRTHCQCPAGFTGRLCQYTSQQSQQAQAAWGHCYYKIPPSVKPGGLVWLTLCFSVQINVRVHHNTDTSVVIHPLDQSDITIPSKTVTRMMTQRHKPKGRCFQETTPKQACNSTPLPVLTNQEDCCGSVGNSWGQNKCYQCPKLPNASVKHTIVEDYGSTCPQGYKRFNSTHCQDINECTMQGVCQNGQCMNTLGSFRCSCKHGLVLDRNRCVGEQPAEYAQCYSIAPLDGRCGGRVLGYLTQELCCCTVGKAWGKNCERCPAEDTAAFQKICPGGKGYFFQKVRNTFAFPPLVFPSPEKGYNKPGKLATAYHLTDVCKTSRYICGHGECESTASGHTCHCNPGYRLHAHRNIYEDECASEPCGAGRGTCVNTDGAYQCHCHHGYKPMVNHGRLKCVDVNECSKQDVCGPGGRCVNLPGSYKCECHKGFKAHRTQTCEDVNECADPNACPGEQCENRPGSYECVRCRPGHEARGGTCYDVDECQKAGVCLNGRCENFPGTFRCLCDEGFLPSADSKFCRDIDECEDDRLCANGHCVNTEGSFHCRCYEGYQRTQEGSHCEDVNECERASICHRGRCINSMGSFRCECQKGYRLDGGRRCLDIDECLEDRNLCKPFGLCKNRPGSYVCECNYGFILSEDKHSCEMVAVEQEEKKECYLNLDDTVFCDSVLATNVSKQECCCSIGVGWGDHCEIYPCPVYHSSEFGSLCPVGRGFYHEEGTTEYGLSLHRDIDECVLFSNEICKEGRCVNTQPGYECYCQQGFYYDSNLLECIGVDECQDPSNCKNGHCVDTPGSYYCICSPPWTLATDRNSCVTPEEQADRTAAHKDVCFRQLDEDLICSMPHNDLVVTYSACCCHYGRGWGPECRTCPPRNSGDSSEEDSDECSCANGRCVRSYLGTMCECNPGFRLDSTRTRCIDINECAEPGVRSNPCKNARCVNTKGSFSCICKPGFGPTRRPNMCMRTKFQ
uniref:Latent transforming growth factor beta binding protein 3 n=1 Tax=Gadus morhua TaxID=8049 RepID=A0A8C5CZ95_GADMO